MNYNDAIIYLANDDVFKAIEDLSRFARERMLEYRNEARGLRAEKKLVKKYLGMPWSDADKIDVIKTVLEEDHGESREET